MAFYKGNGLRLGHYFLFHLLQIQLYHDYLQGDDAMRDEPTYLKLLGTGLICSATLHLLHLGEARLVIQNRIPNFQTYTSFIQMAKNSFFKNRWEYFNGMPGYLPILAITTLVHKQILGLVSI